MRKKLTLTIMASLAVVTAATLIILPLLRTGAEKTSGQALALTTTKAAVPIVTAVATTELFTETLEALGTAKANESVIITPTVDDRVVGIFFDDGEVVIEGQVLVKLDDSEAQYRAGGGKSGSSGAAKAVCKNEPLGKNERDFSLPIG